MIKLDIKDIDILKPVWFLAFQKTKSVLVYLSFHIHAHQKFGISLSFS